ncbi:Dual specificity phosphatase, catalytic domain containing protein [Ectocarpus siliculosus]|uniref:Dual specificity phosphatase, catalytic domain containing protein n=1 Tax=Ectocarpus siliculosus TaxID=2880 RepID=D7G780_ECTSI|nr:Dual specificity phosphatase, catalytic domain containing protein [Ectocarpus siliculosus]|eukprot:CBJ25773.1 Dual specificity phosphatase, catalytic domain containing protein [Ectocarpus siliculosus]
MATKINDGLFIGDAEASQDPEFIELNKITFVINCAGRQLPNLWEQHGLHYLTFPWTSDPDCTLFDGGNVVIEQITNFIDEAAEKGDSVLVHSLDGRGRCIACVSAYLMFRYRWSFEKALDFLCNKRPDAAPNPGFVQQLYRLDLRLYERWYGQSKKPTEDERIRHDQWIPLVPGHVPDREQVRQPRNQGFKAGGQSEFPAPSAASREKNGITTVITDAAAGCFGGAASAFPSLGQLTEVQEEEIVLVNSFLNSQPQIDALPPGRADYEDHVPKELHWIDRPRVDKLTAAGRLGRTKDRRHQHMIPVSPRTGRATPERPGNSSYHALSRGNKTATSTTTAPVGILKKAGTTELNLVIGGGQTLPRSTQPESREVGVPLQSGDTPAAVSGAEGAGGAALVPISSSPSSSTRTVGRAEADKEVVVEDLSDRWSRGDGGTAGSGLSGHETASSGELSSAGHSQGPGALLLEDGMGNSCAAEGDDETDTISTAGNEPGRSDHRSAQVSSSVAPQNDFSSSNYAAPPADRTPKHNHQGASLERGVREGRGPVAAGRKEERQAWDGSTGGGGGADSAGAKKTGGDNGRGRADDSRGKTEPNLLETTARYIEKAKASTLRATSNPLPTNRHTGTKIDVDEKGVSVATTETSAVGLGHTKNQLRRGGSEGSLQRTIPCSRTTGTTANPAAQQDNIRLPKAPVGRPAPKHGKTPIDDPPGPGWGSDDIRSDGFGSGRQRRTEPGGDSPVAAGDEAYRQGPGRWEKKGSRPYPGATDVGGGTLQQLAQAPNPQQRRLPSPRPQQDLGQGDRRQSSSDAGPIFPQKRPNSAPLQRPDGPESDSKSPGPADAAEEERTRGGGGSPAINCASSFGEGPPRAPASSSVGAANQGYPAHGLMPSGSIVQMNVTAGDRGGRLGAAAHGGGGGSGGGSSSSIRPSSRAHGLSVGSSGGGQREAQATLRNGGGGGGREGGAYSSTEQSRLALKSSSEAIDAERRGAKTHQSGYRSSNIGSLPREIRTSQTAEDSSRLRGAGSPAALPNDRDVGVGSVNTDHVRPHGSQRTPSSMAPTSRAKTTGILPPKAGTLPLPSRRRGSSSSDGRDGDGGGGGGSDDLRWANPAPRGRQGHAKGSSGTYGYPGSTDNRGGGSVPSRRQSGDSYGQMPHDGGGQQRSSSRAGGAPIYRSGSPAPVRGRKTANNSAGAAKSADPSRFLYQQRARASEYTPSRIPPGFRGYMASSGGGGGGVADSGRRGATARRSHVPSPKTRDRGQRASGGDTAGRYPVPRASLVADRSPGQRPSTSEGLTGGNGAGRRGRSASPAPRPSSASGRRRSASPSPASLFTSKIDPSFDRPRWK